MEENGLFLGLNSTPHDPSADVRLFIINVPLLCCGMGMLSVALSLPLAEDRASKKVAGDICFPEKKKKGKKRGGKKSSPPV